MEGHFRGPMSPSTTPSRAAQSPNKKEGLLVLVLVSMCPLTKAEVRTLFEPAAGARGRGRRPGCSQSNRFATASPGISVKKQRAEVVPVVVPNCRPPDGTSVIDSNLGAMDAFSNQNPNPANPHVTSLSFSMEGLQKSRPLGIAGDVRVCRRSVSRLTLPLHIPQW